MALQLWWCLALVSIFFRRIRECENVRFSGFSDLNFDEMISIRAHGSWFVCVMRRIYWLGDRWMRSVMFRNVAVGNDAIAIIVVDIYDHVCGSMFGSSAVWFGLWFERGGRKKKDLCCLRIWLFAHNNLLHYLVTEIRFVCYLNYTYFY